MISDRDILYLNTHADVLCLEFAASDVKMLWLERIPLIINPPQMTLCLLSQQ